MSEVQPVAGQAAEQTGLPGATLRQARETIGWSAADLAGKLHLTESAVLSLEADRYEELPGVTFVRGYIRSYAKLVGLDPDVLARQYTQSSVSEPVRALPDLGRTVARSRSRGRLAMTVLLLVVLGALVAGYFWWQDEQSRNAKSQETEEIAFNQVEIERADGTLFIQSLDQLDAYTADLEVAEISLDSLPPALPEENTAEAEESGELADADQVAETAEDATGDATVDGETADESAQVAVSAQHRLELAFTAECWIRITDGTGREVASGLRKAGEVLDLTGDTPFELHLGNASGVQLRFNGQPVDIHSSIRGNVARIKLG